MAFSGGWDCAPGEDIPFYGKRVELGNPVALRKAMLIAGREPDDKIDPADAAQLDLERQEKVHRELLVWARNDHHWSPPDGGKLALAARMGWRDVGEALSENPYLLDGLLCIDTRGDQFDEPGLLMAQSFLLAWSRLAPTRLLVRLLATACATDLVGPAEQAARRSAVGRPEIAAQIDATIGIYQSWSKELQPAIAIAWTRCRQRLRME